MTPRSRTTGAGKTGNRRIEMPQHWRIERVTKAIQGLLDEIDTMSALYDLVKCQHGSDTDALHTVPSADGTGQEDCPCMVAARRVLKMPGGGR